MSDTEICKLLLDPSTYDPDTLDLNTDLEAREYWLEQFIEMISKFSIQAARSQQNDSTAKENANEYKNAFIDMINSIKTNNSESNEKLSIRRILDLNETILRLHGFHDPWHEEKLFENLQSIAQLKSRLEELDKYEWRRKWIELFRGLFAGNIFDRGAQAVSHMLEYNENFALNDALKCIQKRPWLIDCLDHWLDRLEQGEPHKCAVIFVDNSGADIILGVLPFARELLTRGTKVILCANSQPSLNDITHQELDEVIQKCCNECEIIKYAYEINNLIVVSNGQKGPCLDMRKISSELFNAIEKHNPDLLIIEGMGRALHTNLNAKFKCETLKLAVIKNAWLAKRYGGETFSIICKYENACS